MTGWKECLLGDVITLKRGYDLPHSARLPGPFPVVSSSGITDHHAEPKVKAPGVVTGRYGTLGQVFFVSKDYWPLNTSLYVQDFKGNDPKFIALLLSTLSFGSQNAAGAVPGVNRNHLHAMEVSVPPLPIQRRIAGILSAYDDLIENSQRRIKILEKMARRLYRDWFVHFRFPGHENHPRIASPLGEILEGWEVKLIADLCESVSYGYTASASSSEVGPKLLRITDIVPDLINWDDVPYCEISEAKAPKYLLNPGDIVVARTGATTGYAKRLNKLHPSTVFASYLVRVRAGLGVSNRMLGILMESDVYKRFIEMNLGGAAQPQANAVVLTSMRLAIPPAPLADEFDRLVEPIFDEAELLSVKIQSLRRTRDLLLPRLLSGQIDVDILSEPPDADQDACKY